MKSISRVLEASRERISNPSNWTLGAMARADSGLAVPYFHAGATSWCMAGAVMKESSFPSSLARRAISSLREANKQLNPAKACLSLTEVNDSMKHPEVLRIMDHAIMNEKKREEAQNSSVFDKIPTHTRNATS